MHAYPAKSPSGASIYDGQFFPPITAERSRLVGTANRTASLHWESIAGYPTRSPLCLFCNHAASFFSHKRRLCQLSRSSLVSLAPYESNTSRISTWSTQANTTTVRSGLNPLSPMTMLGSARISNRSRSRARPHGEAWYVAS